MKSWLLGLALAFSVPPSAHADQAAEINQMLGYFGANCSVNGEWTQSAAASVNSLISTLKALQADPNCQSVAGAVADLELISYHVQNLESRHNTSDRDVLALENRKRELFFMLGQARSEDESRTLREELRSTQLELAEMRGYQAADRDNEAQLRRSRSLEAMVIGTRSVFDRLAANQACWAQNPSLLQSVAGFGTAVGQSAALGVASGGIATAIGAGLALLANVIDYTHKKAQQAPITSMALTLEGTALTCTLETLSNQWCGAQDTIDAVDLVARALTSPAQEDKVWTGIRLLEREVPNVTGWLETVRAGALPTTSAVSNQRDTLYQKEQKLKSARDFGTGLIAEKHAQFNVPTNDPAEQKLKRWQIEKSILTSIQQHVYADQYGMSTGAANPMAALFSRTAAPYILLGLELKDAPPDGMGGFQDINNFDPFNQWPTSLPPYEPNLDRLLREFESWYERADVLFQEEKSLVIIDDPELIFTEAYARSFHGRQKGLSPRHSLLTILAFLKDQRPNRLSSPSLHKIYNDTVQRIEALVQIIDDVLLNGLDPSDGLKQVSDQSNLRNGTSFFRNRVEFFLRLVIEDLVLKREGLNDPQAIQLLAAHDVITTLKNYSGRQSLQSLVADAKQAQSVVSMSLDKFLGTFAPHVSSSLARYDQQITRLREDTEGPNSHAKAVMCLNLLASPVWNASLSLERCLNAQIKSVFPGGPASEAFTQTQFNRPFKQRVCLYRDFLRKNNIFQALAENGRAIRFAPSTPAPGLFTPNPNAQPAPTSGEVAVIDPSCQGAEAWRTDSNSYCEKDWWSGCGREHARKCEAVPRRRGLR